MLRKVWKLYSLTAQRVIRVRTEFDHPIPDEVMTGGLVNPGVVRTFFPFFLFPYLDMDRGRESRSLRIPVVGPLSARVIWHTHTNAMSGFASRTPVHVEMVVGFVKLWRE